MIRLFFTKARLKNFRARAYVCISFLRFYLFLLLGKIFKTGLIVGQYRYVYSIIFL